MSFPNQYIEKYGEKALEIYKKSLRHSDIHPESQRYSPKHLIPKITTNQHLKRQFGSHEKDQIIKRNASQTRIQHSKSNKSLTKHNNQKNSDQLKNHSKQKNSRSMLDNQPNNGQNHPQNRGTANKGSKLSNGFTHTFNNIHLNLNKLKNPQKKKLVISEIQTPKHQTPCKSNSYHINGTKDKQNLHNQLPQNATGMPRIQTNVNVFVNACNKSKSKSKERERKIQDIYIREDTFLRSKSRSSSYQKKQIKTKRKNIHKHTLGDIIADIQSILQDDQKYLQNHAKNMIALKNKFHALKNQVESKDQKYQKIKKKIKQMKQIIQQETLTKQFNRTHSNFNLFSKESRKSYYEEQNNSSVNNLLQKQSQENTKKMSKENDKYNLEEKVLKLEKQILKYKDKEVTMMKILQTFSKDKVRQGKKHQQKELCLESSDKNGRKCMNSNIGCPEVILNSSEEEQSEEEDSSEEGDEAIEASSSEQSEQYLK